MTVVLNETLSLMLFAFVGYLLAKLKLVKSEHTAILSALEVYVFCPCLAFNTFSKNCTRQTISEKMPFIVAAFAILAVIIAVAYVITRSCWRDPFLRNIYHYALVVPNYGYMGYALALSIYGETALLNAMIFCLPINLYTYTVAFPLITGSGKVSPRKMLNPSNVAICLGCIVGLLAIPLPDIISSSVSKAGACMSPVSMILTGIVLSEFPVLKLIRNKSAIFISVLRLIVIPVAVILITKQFFSTDVAVIAGLICAMPCGLNTIVFPRLVGRDCEPGAAMAFISNIMALVTVPAILALFF